MKGLPVLKALAIATAGGALATWLHVPLGWLIGALAASTLAAGSGFVVAPPPGGRHLGQLIIGVGIGLKVSAAVLAKALALAPYMLITTAYVMLVTTLAAAAMARVAGVDRRSAFLATSSAGVTEMAVLARELGGNPAVVSLTQTLRVAIIILVIPVLVVMFGQDGGMPDTEAGARMLGWSQCAGLGAFAAGLGALLAQVPRWPAPWLFGPILAGMAVALMGGPAQVLPPETLVVAQVLIGMVLGCRFNRPVLVTLPRVALAGVVIALALIGAGLAGGFALHAVTGMPVETAILAAAPAGIAEMVLTAKALHLDGVTVTAFHLVRIIAVTATARLLLTLYERLDPATSAPANP